MFTHDSVGVGEDGPTHQPVEHLAALRAIPGLHVIRPADGNETIHAWVDAVRHDGPTALILSRQNIEVTTDGSAVERGRGHRRRRRHRPASCSSVPAARSPCASHAARATRRCRRRRPGREPAELGPVRGTGRRVPRRRSCRRASRCCRSRRRARSAGRRGPTNRSGSTASVPSAPGEFVLEKLGINVGHVVECASALIAAS